MRLHTKGSLLALPKNVRLGWELLTVATINDTVLIS